MLEMMRRVTRPARRATFPARRWLANSIYTPPALPPEMTSIAFSSSGEDVMAVSWLRSSGIDLSTVRYLDIGAAEPKRLSNTYLLYTLGASGVLVEPDPDQVHELRSARSRDTVLSAAIAFDDRRRAPLARMRRRVFNTFLEGHAEKIIAASSGWPGNQQESIVDRIEVDLLPINDVIERYMGGVAPDFLSIDTEGCDFDILRSLDLARFRPRLICIEPDQPVHEFAKLLEPLGYLLVCPTPDNLMFLR